MDNQFAILYKDGTNEIVSLSEEAEFQFMMSHKKLGVDSVITESQLHSLYKIYDGEKWVYSWDNSQLHSEIDQARQSGMVEYFTPQLKYFNEI